MTEAEIYPESQTGAFSLNLRGSVARRVVQQVECAWTGPVVDVLNKLVALPRGWDGYSAGPVRFDTANFALQLLEQSLSIDACAPQIVPGIEGDLQIEWHLPEGDVELHVVRPYEVDAWSRVNGAESQVALTNDFMIVADWLENLEPNGAHAAAA